MGKGLIAVAIADGKTIVKKELNGITMNEITMAICDLELIKKDLLQIYESKFRKNF